MNVPYDITVRELNNRFTEITGAGGHRFQYRFYDEELEYDRNFKVL